MLHSPIAPFVATFVNVLLLGVNHDYDQVIGANEVVGNGVHGHNANQRYLPRIGHGFSGAHADAQAGKGTGTNGDCNAFDAVFGYLAVAQ